MAAEGKVVLCSGETVEVFDGKKRKDIQELYTWSKKGFLKSVDGAGMMPIEYLKYDKKVYNFEFRNSDVFVNGYFKSGTTWTQDMMWHMLHNPDQDNPHSEKVLWSRVPWLENDGYKQLDEGWFYQDMIDMYNFTDDKADLIDNFRLIKSQRLIRTHMFAKTVNMDMLNVSKMVYVLRNPLDSAISYYFFHKYLASFYDFQGDMNEFADLIISGHVLIGNAAQHILSWWPYRHHKNFYLVRYEEMRSNPNSELKKLAKFLEIELSDKQISNIVKVTSFEHVKAIAKKYEEASNLTNKKETTEEGGFYRKGLVGDSKKRFPKDVYNKLAAYFETELGHLDLGYDFSPM